MKNVEQMLEQIKAGTSQVLPESDLIKKLEEGRPLKIKFGADPTAPDLHLGHAVVLSKLRQFQDLGHTVIFLIGDFTARIGDPTGKTKTRPPLTEAEIKKNTATYFEQVGTILDKDKLTIRYNSEWLDKLSAKQMVELCSKVTLARLTEREDFHSRMQKKQSISFHELLYPIFQAYDSVALEADIELGGTDQTFNLLLGRFLQEQFGQKPQAIVTMPLLEGLDGVKKMSKSLDNAIGLTEPADQAYGKLMSISDTLMWRYLELLLGRGPSELSQMKERVASGNLHPMELKKEMAQGIIAKFWSESAAEAARASFEAVFQKKDYSKVKEVKISKNLQSPVWIVHLLKELGAVNSSSEAKRLVEAGAVYIDEQAVSEFRAEIAWKEGTVVKIGKHRIYRLV